MLFSTFIEINTNQKKSKITNKGFYPNNKKNFPFEFMLLVNSLISS